MLEVTSAAVDAISGMLADGDAGEGDCLRLAEQGAGQLTFHVDREAPGDQVVRAGEQPVLVIDERVSGVLEGATLDFAPATEGASEPQFVLTRE